MIRKIPGNAELKNFLVIQLLEVNINMYPQLLCGKRIISDTLHKYIFCPEQLNNQAGLSRSSAPPLKVLTFDMI